MKLLESPHIHAILIPKLWNEKRKTYTLQAYQYFNGPEKLKELQDSYSETMSKDFKCLQRGIKGSKAKHIKIKTFYTLINKDLSELTREELEAKAKHEEMLSMKMKFADKTMKSFQYQNNIKSEKIDQLELELSELKKENQELKKGVKIENKTEVKKRRRI